MAKPSIARWVPALLVVHVVSAGAATITVTGNGDALGVDSAVTLREAITSINNGANFNADVVAVGAYGSNDTINFNIAPAGFYLINIIGSSLPTLTKPVTINGQTQGGSVQNSAVTGDNSTHNIMLNCSGANTCTDGLTLGAGSAGSTIRFLIFDSAPGAGIVVNSANNVIAGNWVGLDSAGVGAAGPNATGISMSATGPTQDVSGNVIGGPNPADRNVIAGNTTRQILIGRFDSGGFGGGSNIVVENNYIGPNKTGAVALSGGQGIFMADVLAATIGGASNSLGGSCSGVCNLIAGSGGSVGIAMSGTTSNGNLIQGNFFGTDVTGATALPNGSSANIDISQSNTVTIGGTAAGAGNLISGEAGQGVGILVDGGVVGPVNIQGNFIGTTTTGNATLGNGGSGIRVVGSTNVNIGGMAAGARNVIGGNGNGNTPKGPGILIEGNPPFSTATAVIQGNNIGIGADGSTNVGNIGDGIDFNSTASGSTVGASSSGGAGGNTIAFNGAGRTNGAGIGVPNGDNANKILSNSIFGNTGSTTGLGIDLSAAGAATDGPTANDNCDPDAGGNGLQNFPVLTSAQTSGSSITIAGALDSIASTTLTVEFFSNGSGSQGQAFLGSTSVGTNGACTGSFSATLPQSVAIGANITATATDPTGNTSEFSAALAATAAPPTVVKSFGPTSIGIGGTATLTVTLTNPNGIALTGVAFTDTYPAGLINATPAIGATTCGGLLTAANGGGSMALNGGTISANASCTVTAAVTSNTANPYLNTIGIGAVTTTNGGSNTAPAGATLTVAALAPPTVSKSFSPNPLAAGATSTLTITLTNPNGAVITGVAFTDTYPAGLINATPANGATTCGGAVLANNGGGSVALSGGTIPASGSCTVTALVTAAGAGSLQNTIPAGSVTSTNAPVSTAAAAATLAVNADVTSIPTLSGWALLLLAIALGGIGLIALRRT